MHQQYPLEKKRPFFSKVHQIVEEDDDEQVKKTLHFFDSILDEYLDDHEISVRDQSLSLSATNLSQIKSSKTHSGTRLEKHLLHPMDAVQSRFTAAPAEVTRVPYVRRYTSENNLNQLHVLSKPAMLQKSHRNSLLQTTATSTEDLPQRSSMKNSSSQTNLSSSMGISASLIDLSTINQVTARPLFRFVPPSKYPTTIVKPTVITPTAIPSLSPSAPISRFTENNFHHENGVSAFKPLVSSKTHPPVKLEPANHKRTELLHPSSAVHVGLSNQSTAPAPLLRQAQTAKPYYHQSMFDLPSNDTHSHVSRLSIEPNSNHPHYVRQTNPPPRPTRYYPPSSRSPPSLLTEPVTKWIQQMKNSSSMQGLVHSIPHRPPDYHPSPSYVPTGSRSSFQEDRTCPFPFAAMNSFDRSSLYPTPVNLRPNPATAGNIYHFNAKSSKSNPRGHEFILTTYL